MNRPSKEHIRLNDVRLSIATETSTLALVISSMNVQVSIETLQLLHRHLIPEQDLRIRVAENASPDRASLIIEAPQWRVTARMQVTLQIASSVDGAIELQYLPERRWSPLDQAMVSIVRAKVREVAVERDDIIPLEGDRIRIDLQSIINHLITSRDAPIHWNTVLTEIASTPDAVRFAFEPALH